jgi:hypothetical protein
LGTILKFVPRKKKNWAALLVNTYFSLALHPPPPLKSVFEVLMTRQNPYNKVPVKFSEEAPRFYR